MIDSHVHLSYGCFQKDEFSYLDLEAGGYVVRRGNRDQLIRGMRESGITACIEPAIDVASNERVLTLCDQFPGYIYPAVGIHPAWCKDCSEEDKETVRKHASDSRVVAIGETGLDYYYDSSEQYKEKQKQVFLWHIELAHEHKLPLILHMRTQEAMVDAFDILRDNEDKLHGGVCHCFKGSVDLARLFVNELHMCVGIGGALLTGDEAARILRDVVDEIPLKNILLETDAPYVKPQKSEYITGKQWKKAANTSLILPMVAKKIAEIKGFSAEDVEQETSENVLRVFRLR